jgi:hypothetical protein
VEACSIVTPGSAAPFGATWPAPKSNASPAVAPFSFVTSCRAVSMNADLIWSGDQSGWAWVSSAARPAICGDDIDVPLMDWNSSPGAPRNGVGDAPARMLTPGAVMSGFRMAASAPFGPRDENSAMTEPGVAVATPWAIAALGPVVPAM